MCVCVCVCVCARARAFVPVRACVRVWIIHFVNITVSVPMRTAVLRHLHRIILCPNRKSLAPANSTGRTEGDQRSNPLKVSTKRLYSPLADAFVISIVLAMFRTAPPRVAGVLFHTDDLLLVQTRSESATTYGDDSTELVSSCGLDKIRTRVPQHQTMNKA